MSIEKYLNEIANEGVGSFIGILATAIGAGIGYGAIVSKRKKNKNKEKDETYKKNLEEQKKKILSKYNGIQENLFKNVANDIQKLINKINQDKNIKEKIENDIAKLREKFPKENLNYEIKFNNTHFDKDGGAIYIIHTPNYLSQIPHKLSWVINDIIKTLKLKYSDEISLGLLTIYREHEDDTFIDIS